MAISASYHKEMSIALPGQVSDVSRYNIDGATVLGGEATLMCGLAVYVEKVEADGVKEVRKVATGKVPYGVAIRSHFATITTADGQMAYNVADGVNVMTAGRVWMIAEAKMNPGFGTAVKLSAEGKVKTEGEITPSGWTFAGGVTEFNGVHLVEVQLHQL